MTYSVELAKSADKFLTKLSRAQPKDVAAIEDAIEDLADDPRPSNCKPLAGYRNVWRIRVGGYRICYTVDDGKVVVLVVAIGTRDDVYAVLKRYLER